MKRKVLLGAPSSTGKGANEIIAEAFSNSAFPLEVTFENKVAHALVIPEAGLHLKSCTDPDRTQTATIKDLDALQRLGSTVEQIAFLHNHKVQVIELEAEDGETEAPEAPEKTGDVKDVDKDIKDEAGNAKHKRNGR